MRNRQRAVAVMLVGVLALGVGVSGSVAAGPVGPLDNDTNTTDSTDSLSTTTNETLDGGENTTSDTADILDVTAGTVNDTSGTVNDTTESVASTVDNDTEETTETLADDETLAEMLLTDPEHLGDATGTLDGDADIDATATPHEADDSNETAGATGAEPTVGDAGAGTGLSGLGADLPASPAAGAAAIGLGAVLAGAVGRQLAGTATAAQGLTAGASGALDRLFRMVAPLRYSRYDDSNPLEHEDRAAVLEAVDDSPGVYLTELSEQLDVSLSTLRHHVRVLEREDLLAAAQVRGRRRFYPAHTEEIELVAAMNDEATAPIVDALARLGGASVSDLADVIDRDASTVTYHLQRLEADGLVVREREGRAIVNRLAPEAQEALTPLVDADGEPRDGEADAKAVVSAD